MSNMFLSELNEIIESLSSAREDAEKFSAGNDAAGKRLRSACQNAKNSLQTLRVSVQTERNARKA
jgi:flagellar hook-basal body complex protein FliE